MECIQNEKKVLNTDINKLNWRFNQIFFSDHKTGHLLYVNRSISLIIEIPCWQNISMIPSGPQLPCFFTIIFISFFVYFFHICIVYIFCCLL